MGENLREDFIRSLLPERPAEGHKGTFGHTFVVGGSRGFTGAVKLAAMAAARSGTGLVTAGVPRPLGDVVAAGLLEVMTHPLPATEDEALSAEAAVPALDFAASCDSVALGPGIGHGESTCKFVLEFVERCPQPTLIDADGLNCLSTSLETLDRSAGPRVLTPHPGEMARLTGRTTAQVQADRETLAQQFAQEHNCVLVLKGHRTAIAAPDGEVYINPTGNNGMATGGTGDVLSGLIAGLLAQGLTPKDAALVGVYLHGLAGDIAASTKTQRALIAGDLIEAFPEAWRTLEGNQNV